MKNNAGWIVAIFAAIGVLGLPSITQNLPAPEKITQTISQSAITQQAPIPVSDSTVYSYAQLKQALINNKLDANQANIGAAIAEAESHGKATDVHFCPPDCIPGQLPERSYGPWQINTLAHPWVAPICAEDLNCAAHATVIIATTKYGISWYPWSTYQYGQYKQYLHE